MKILKKVLKITGITFGILLLLLFIAPFLFKDKIKGIIDEQIASSLNAKVYYADYSLSFFRNFPNLSVGLENFGVVSDTSVFKGDTLFKAESFRLSVDVMSVISGDQIKVKGLYLKKPYILTMYDKDGNFSWDITKPSTDTTATTDTTTTKFSLKVDRWEIEDGWIIYSDQTMPMYAEMRGFNHKGSGDITESIYDLKTYTDIQELTFTFDGTTYLNKFRFVADVTMNIDNAKSVYTFKDNKFTLNNFNLGFSGNIAMPGNDITMDIKYNAPETDFKNLISLIPAVYAKDYDKLEAKGQVGFDGYVKGTYNDNTMPGFGLNLKVDNGYMHYPDLPSALKDVKVDLGVDCKDGVIDNINVNLRQFHMLMGSNPIDAKAILNGLNPYNIDANVKAKLNLAELMTMFPMDGLTLKGIFGLDVTAKGKYSDVQKLMPVVVANMSLENGYVKSKDFPEPLENLSMKASVNSNGDMVNSSAILDYFRMSLQGEPFEMNANVKNFDDPNYDVTVKGIIDLTKLMKIYPMEDMTLAGRLNTTIQTKGIMSEVLAGHYNKTSTSGSMEMSNFFFSSPDLPQGLKLTNASVNLTPEKIVINSMNGFIGKSDMSVSGYLSNYMGYTFGGTDSTIHGKMNFASKKFDTNEWMEEDSTATASPEEIATAEEGVAEIPKTIDFVLVSTINEVLYDNMTLKDLNGTIVMKNGEMRMDQVKFNTLGGSFITDGTYNTQNLKHPWFDFKLDMQNVSIKESFKTFNTVQHLAPAAENMEGTYSCKMTIKSEMDKEYMPVYPTMNGDGVMTVNAATFKGSKVMKGIATATKQQGLDPIQMKDVKISFQIIKGRVFVKPFDLMAGSTKLTIEGSNGFEGDLDYKIKMDIPAAQAGATMSSITGKNLTPTKNLKVDLKVTGNATEPKVGIAGSNAPELVKDAVVNSITTNPQVQQGQQQVQQTVQQGKDSIKNQVNQQVQQQQQQVKDKAQQKADSIKKNLQKNPPVKIPPVKKPW